MRKVKLLESYGGAGRGEIISVSNNIAFGLIDSGKAVGVDMVQDSIKKIELGRTKAFTRPPMKQTR